jgi:hypothetical protein
MNKKKVVFLSLSIILTFAVLLVIFNEKLASAFLFKDVRPREPKNEIEVTYNIGWWAYQESMKIDSFTVEILDSKLNLFNSNSLISYTIRGELSNRVKWKPHVKNIHLSERFIRYYNRELHPYLDHDTCKIHEAIIEITPIIDVKEDKSYNGEIIPFEITNELKIQSAHWGNNWIRFQCGNKHKDIILSQRK